MKKILSLIALSLTVGLSAYAADGPKADLFFGYSFLRANSAQTIPAFTMNEGLGTFGYNFNDHWAFEAELGGYHNGNINNHEFDNTTFSYLFGIRASVNRSKRIDPYGHALFGGQDLSSSICCIAPATGNMQVSSGTRVSHDANSFAMAVGGGLDIKMTKHLLLRPIQLDYYLTRFEAVNVNNLTGPTSNRNQNNLRYAAGIVFNFGGAQ
jgi:opacity protein-like surface antigen